MARVQKDQTWMKNHPLEGDDVVTGLYNILAKRNPKTMKACHGIRIPDTVVFEHNFPRGWYTTDMKANEVVRKQGKELDANTIEQGFTQDLTDSSPIAASYLCTTEVDSDKGDDGVSTLVEVFNKDTLGAFLARKTKPGGILQKFIMPKSYQNSVIKAVWSPRVCMVQRRTNKYRIFDRKRAERDPFSTTVTYDGPTFLSDEGSVSGNIAVEVKELCGNIVQHFYYTEHKYITRMVLYFKADQRDRLWLLWCGSLRVSDRDTPSEMPVNLITNFAEPSDAGSAFNEDTLLRNADEAYLRLTNDEMFYETYMKTAKKADSVRAEANASTTAHTTEAADSQQASMSKGVVQEEAFDWTGVPAIVLESRDRLCQEKETMCSLFEDLFYNARNHFLTRRNEPYDMIIPQRAKETLTENGVVDLMRTLRISPKSQPTNASAPLSYVIEPAARQPLTQLLDRAQLWIKNFFDARLRGCSRR
ncbi:hypothetical protein ABB37_09572 [Leptomonas pyrrhocoris]|uniref:Uncharacterized protein n=1 Tax=Leptomonas pyrrhocoris TaxID=157538 RepID=A0A0N0DR64_LEPPY|nr:hypothetical protein ABB37_09572 [Leptomonas pyrrhocoris]XP_015652451.1 hypothetical protein ABB37_09572 [Leptomonas pyrrhocoris]KPA74011.1 hypothetical protein ABB37_09572 [Leptomonas pyrrhocoris]KPA74012.1 hypothetical protein ABB37_09572 [Leptomonas pyrrhocoris]|eukprot:XP_015652450.1 hypothetical protein ABB37_09572 [Leptomonas pyrrhocoris]